MSSHHFLNVHGGKKEVVNALPDAKPRLCLVIFGRYMHRDRVSGSFGMQTGIYRKAADYLQGKYAAREIERDR